MPRRHTLPALLATTAAVAGLALVAPSAASASAASSRGLVTSAVQDTSSHAVTIRGWAYDAEHPAASIVVALYADGRLLARVRTTDSSATLNRTRHISGRHGYTLRTRSTAALRTIAVRTEGGKPTADHRSVLLDTTPVSRVAPSAGARIVAAAKSFVGKARYREGGASPRTGFDCSGYTQYVYAMAKVGRLPHNAAAQKSLRGMRAVSAKAARPGDLVFYHGGGGIFHVAIYAGNHKQYAAATPRDGIVYQEIWSSAVSYGHLG